MIMMVGSTSGFCFLIIILQVNPVQFVMSGGQSGIPDPFSPGTGPGTQERAAYLMNDNMVPRYGIYYSCSNIIQSYE
jgi:hypothetical protein